MYTNDQGLRTLSLFPWQRSQTAFHEQLNGGGGGRRHHETQVGGVLVGRDVNEPLAPASLRPLHS